MKRAILNCVDIKLFPAKAHGRKMKVIVQTRSVTPASEPGSSDFHQRDEDENVDLFAS